MVDSQTTRNRKRTRHPAAALLVALATWLLFAMAQVVREAASGAENAPPTGVLSTKESASADSEGDLSDSRKKDLPILHLRDASRIAGWPQLDSLSVETQYGPLSVPKEQLVRVRFARRLAPELSAKIEQLISDLGSDDFDRREAAMAELRKIGGPALDALRKAVRSTNEEIKSRAASLVGEIGEKGAAAAALLGDGIAPVSGTDDEVVTRRMTIRGRVAAEELLVSTPYGQLRVRVADLNGISFRSLAPSRIKVKISAQDQPPGRWVDTKIDLDRSQKFKVSASGQISVSNYGIVSGPAGNSEWSGRATFGNFPMLSLVGRVGKKGQPFLVGENYTGKAQAQGRLYLGVVAFSPYPGGAAGNYEAQIQAMGAE